MTSFTSRYGNPAHDFAGVHLWTHERHGCTVLAVRGRIDGTNIDDIIGCARRVGATASHLILDLTGVTSCTPNGVRLLRDIDERCGQRGSQWVLVAGNPVLQRIRGRDGSLTVPLAESVAQAERRFDDAVSARRRMLLPLLGRTA